MTRGDGWVPICTGTNGEWGRAVIALAGEANQSLPLLVPADGATSVHQTGTHDGRAFIVDKDGILTALSERYGVAA